MLIKLVCGEVDPQLVNYMNDIDKEIVKIIFILSHPAGFDLDMCGMLCIRPIDECSPPIRYEVDWEEYIDGKTCSLYKEFDTLESAAIFFVHKRHELQYGLDYEV